jgi:hypothetical protein
MKCVWCDQRFSLDEHGEVARFKHMYRDHVTEPVRHKLTQQEIDRYMNKTVIIHGKCCRVNDPSLFKNAQELYDELFDQHSPEIANMWYDREFQVIH